MLGILVGLCTALSAAGPIYKDYNKPLTRSDSQDIYYIITNLSNSSVINIMLNRSSIEKAGDRIDPVHPLQFLLSIFSNKELIICIHNIKNRPLIWKDFSKGLETSLQRESSEKNFDKYMADFASKLKIRADLLEKPAKEKKWDKFLGVLFAQIPLKSDRNY
ncbi:MAG: hypothetical protein WCN87_00630 [Chlamydiota bacterium]